MNTSGVVWLTNFRTKSSSHGVRYEPCSPAKCRWLIENSGIDPKEFLFIDIGSGKGRPLIIASQHNFAGLIGVEHSRKLCDVARANMQKLNIAAQIICLDAPLFQFPDRDAFVFFFHPFDSVILDTVLANLRSARRVVVAYEGIGREDVANHKWLKPFAGRDDAIIYRNFQLPVLASLVPANHSGPIPSTINITLYRRFFPNASASEAEAFVELNRHAETMAEFQGLLLSLQRDQPANEPIAD